MFQVIVLSVVEVVTDSFQDDPLLFHVNQAY